MAIIRTTTDQSTNAVTSQTTHFLGRVVRTEVVTETRNWSDTLDYSDYRSTQCIYALVYMGRHGIVPMTRNGRTVAGVIPYPGSELRDLEVGVVVVHGDRQRFGQRRKLEVSCEVLISSRGGSCSDALPCLRSRTFDLALSRS